MIKNRIGIIIVFFPLVLFNLIFITVDHFQVDHHYFPEAYEYFKSLYSNRFLILAFFILMWKWAKKVVSGYVLLFIIYFFNILTVLSDIFNINEFIYKYRDSPQAAHSVFYDSLYMKLCVNYFFLVSWVGLLFYNMVKWYNLYRMSQSLDVEEIDEHVKTE